MSGTPMKGEPAVEMDCGVDRFVGTVEDGADGGDNDGDVDTDASTLSPIVSRSSATIIQSWSKAGHGIALPWLNTKEYLGADHSFKKI